jgi:hypothetical protein
MGYKPVAHESSDCGNFASKVVLQYPESPTGTAAVTFAVITSPFSTTAYQDRDVIVPTLRDDLTWTKGNHTLQFGASYKPIRQNTTLTNDLDFSCCWARRRLDGA